MSDQEGGMDWVFNIDEDERGIFRKLTEGVTTRIFCGDQAMISIVRVEPNITSVVHSHPEEQWGVLLEGECVRVQGGEEATVRQGDFWHTPANVPHGVKTGETGAVILDIFSPPREEYRKPGEGFGT